MTIKTMAIELDKTGARVNVKHTNSVGQTPVIPFFMKQFAATIDAGFANPVITIHNSNMAIYAEIDGKVVGHIVYKFQDDQVKTAWIILSAVDNDYRRRGIYNLMHKQFEKVIKSSGCKKISSHVHVDNAARLASCESAGLEKVWYKMEKNL